MDKKILILEDHNIVATGLTNLIKQEFVGYSSTVAITFPDGLELLTVHKPVELIILDVQLPGSEAARMVSLLRDIQPDVRILVFTALESTQNALSFLKAGANGFVSKTLDLSIVARAIKTVLEGKKFITEDVQQTIADSFFQNPATAPVYKDMSLSPREQEVLELMLEGKKTKEISNDLKLKLTTVSSHKTRIFEKLHVRNIVELVRKYRAE